MITELQQNILAIFLLFLVYTIFSNPQLYISLSRKRFVAYKFFNLRLRSFNYEKPRHLHSVFFLIPAFREIFQILFRSQNVRKLIKTLTNKNLLNYDQIHEKISKQRFNPRHPYLTSGDHFSSFYPRNLGLFYSYSLIPNNTINITDYQNRLSTYLNSLHFCLGFFENRKPTTTIVPIFRSYFYSANIYREPSDTLLSIFLSFDRLINPQDNSYENSDSGYKISQEQAQKYALTLLDEFKLDLYGKVLDLLGKINIEESLLDNKYSFSGIRDGIIRNQCFYDNVCLWKTLDLAIKLDIVSENELEGFETLATIKSSIINTFVVDGVIYDKSKNIEVVDNPLNLSADFLVAYSTGFFNTKEKLDSQVLIATIKRFEKYSLIHKLGIQYSKENSKYTQWAVKLVCPSYMGKSIWSHWSVELGMVCLDLIKNQSENKISPNDIGYLTGIAQNIYSSTNQKIVQYQGYPELYNLNGVIFANFFYSSILQTGWIVNFNWFKINFEKLVSS